MASDLIVPVVEVRNVREHPGADMLSICEVLGYQMVNGLVEDPNGPLIRYFVHGEGEEPKRDEKGRPIPCSPDDEEVRRTDGIISIRFNFRYKDGDKAVYFCADTVLSDELAEKFEVKHLLKGGNRVGRARLRGEPSFGLIVALPEGVDWELGQNVAEFYDVQKYVPPPRNDPGDIAPYDSDIDPHFVTYTDIQNGLLLYEKFQEGEEVVATEKIHGCLDENTLVALANGEERAIKEIMSGDVVLAFNEQMGDLVPRKVLDVIERAPAGDWLELEFEDGRSIRCTADHLFLTDRGWIAAADLTTTDDVVDAFESLCRP